MKTIRNLMCSVLIFSVISCLQNDRKTSNENVLIPKENIKAILDSFVIQNKNDNFAFYELYIDKLDPHNYNLLLYAGEKSLTKSENEFNNHVSINSVIIQGVRIAIYSGVEHYFMSQKQQNLTEKIISEGPRQVMLAIKDSSNILTSYEIYGGYPFMPLPRKIEPGLYAPPVVTLD